MAKPSRERARGLLVKALYQWQLAGHSCEELLEQYRELAEYGRCDQAYFEALLLQSIELSAEADALIGELADRGVDQLDAVGRAILLLAIAELRSRDDVPSKVVINEAVNLAKRYGATDSYRFINAVVDRAAQRLRSDPRASTG